MEIPAATALETKTVTKITTINLPIVIEIAANSLNYNPYPNRSASKSNSFIKLITFGPNPVLTFFAPEIC